MASAAAKAGSDQGVRAVRPLSIQIVSTHYAPESTGNAPYVASLAEGLAARGHQVSVLAAAPHYPARAVFPESEWSREEVAENLRVRRFVAPIPARPSFVSRLVYEVRFGLQFAQQLDCTADVVLLVSPTLFADIVVRAKLLARRERPRLVAWMQDLYSAGVSETPGRAARLMAGAVRAVEGAFARSCDAVVVIHDRFREFATREFGVTPDRLRVIRNWSHVSIPERVDRDEVRSRLGWASDEVVVLHAGNMGEKQGLENVVDAAWRAQERGAAVRFVLMGDGNQRPSLEERGIGCTHLEFIPPVADSEFTSVLAAADVLLVNERPSLREAAVPSKLTSYFATGRPVLAATAADSATSDEIRRSRAGRVVAPADPDALLDGAVAVAQRWDATDELAGPAFVRAVLSAESALNSFETLLQAVARDTEDGLTTSTSPRKASEEKLHVTT